METKMFEIRDIGTFIPVVCVACESDNEQEAYLLRRSGFRTRCIQLSSFIRKQANYDCYDWGDRTYQVAHKYIEENWDNLERGQVIDVETILGETDKPKVSERIE